MIEWGREPIVRGIACAVSATKEEKLSDLLAFPQLM